ncbi:hypothetical protein VDQ16_21610, partial [Xanthomonas campestris pv. campestris]|nr:hypothetical protein [Xanthomonas campestris pv. campestris]MEB1358329.1 hypothetical protein [Xanthomonas campestris pv. campestris]MEB1449299.1 hypothetical protein [Xanthomonas campestris pv. campestris]
NKPTTQYPSTPGFISNHWYGRWGQVKSTRPTPATTHPHYLAICAASHAINNFKYQNSPVDFFKSH